MQALFGAVIGVIAFIVTLIFSKKSRLFWGTIFIVGGCLLLLANGATMALMFGVTVGIFIMSALCEW